MMKLNWMSWPPLARSSFLYSLAMVLFLLVFGFCLAPWLLILGMKLRKPWIKSIALIWYVVSILLSYKVLINPIARGLPQVRGMVDAYIKANP